MKRNAEKGKSRIVAQFLPRAHQRHVLLERYAIVLVVQRLKFDTAPRQERLLARPLRHGEAHQSTRQTGCNGELSHRFVARCYLRSCF